MNLRRHNRRRGRSQRAHPIFSLWLILTLLLGGLMGPGFLTPTTLAARPQQAIPQQDSTLGKSEQSDFSIDGFASYGEIITYTLRYTIPAGTSISNVRLEDNYGEPPEQPIFLPVSFINSDGPIAIGATPSVTPVTPSWDDPSGQGRPEITWALEDIANGTGTPYVYEIHYHVRVYFDDNGNTNRRAYNEAILYWNGGATSPQIHETHLVQPHSFTFNKTQYPSPPPPEEGLAPGEYITWTLELRNNTAPYQGVAYNLHLSDTMPAGTTYLGAGGPVSETHVGNSVYWTYPELAVGDIEYFYIYAALPLTGNVAHDLIYNVADLERSSCPGNCEGERTYDLHRDITAYLSNLVVDKAQYSPAYPSNPNNDDRRAEAGEFVTITVDYTVPTGTIIYSHTVRIFLEDGLFFEYMIDPPVGPNIIFDPSAQDTWGPTGHWTQLEWANRPPITNTDSQAVSRTYQFVARVTQDYFLPNHSGEVFPHADLLGIVPLIRWSGQLDVPVDDLHSYLRVKNDVTNNEDVAVRFIRPNLQNLNVNSGSYIEHTFSGDEFQGGANINFFLHLKNRTNNVAHPNAYEVLLTNTLSPELTFVSADPPTYITDVIPGLGTFIYWSLTDPVSGTEEQIFTIVATMPPTMVAGAPVTSTAYARYTTFEGTVPDEGDYVDNPYTARESIIGGFELEKTADPGGDVAIGGVVDYSLVLTLNPGMVMYQPSYNDRLPLGFHYVSGTLQVDGSTIITGPQIICDQGDDQETIAWSVGTINNAAGSEPISITISYQAVLSGTDCSGDNVYDTKGDFISRRPVKNLVNTCWHTTSSPDSEVYCSENPFEADSWVVQPYMGDDINFVKVRPDMPKVAYEVSQTVRFEVTLHNRDGDGSAYEIIIGDTLPDGIAILESWLSPSDPGLIDPPLFEATGVVSWTIGQLLPGQSVALNYEAIVWPSAIPGDWLTNTAYLIDYSSQPGDDNPYDRHYSDFGDAIPEPTDGDAFFVLGLTVDKLDDPDPVSPGYTLTYRLEFGNTSEEYTATNALITDTYDANTTFIDAQFSDPSIYPVSFNPMSRTLVWAKNEIPTQGNHDDFWIEIRLLVDEPMDQDDFLLHNYAVIDGEGDRVGLVERIETTRVSMPYMIITKTSYPTNVSPNDLITYTLSFINIGDINATNVWVEEIYDPNVTYVSAAPPPSEGNNRWHFDTLAAGGGSDGLVVVVRANRPIPAWVETLTNSVRLYCEEVFPVDGPPATTGLFVPRLLVTAFDDNPDPVDVGGTVSYAIQYVNQGESATNVILKDHFHRYADTLGNATPEPDYCVPEDRYCVWLLGTLQGGQNGSVLLQVEVADHVPGSLREITNTVSLESDEVGPALFTEVTRLNITEFLIYLPLILKGY